MLKKSLVSSIILSSLLNAQTIENIVNNTLNNNASLKAIESSIEASKEQIKLSHKWSNPIISFGATDIQFEDTLNRDKEAMQAQFVGITQTLPLGKKLEIEKDIAINEYDISKYQFYDKQLQLKSSIYEYSYNIKLLEERFNLITEFISNNNKLHSLLTKLYEHDKATKIQIIENELLSKDLKLKSQNIKTLIQTMKYKLQELSYENIETIDFITDLKKLNFKANINNHPKILELEKTREKFIKQSNLEKEKKYSDLKMSLTYFQRDKKFNDYMNLSFAIPLSVFDTENIKSAKAKFKSMETNHKIEDLKIRFLTQIKNLEQKINDSIVTFNIIHEEILPKYYEMQKILENYNSYNAYKNFDTKSLIKNQNEIIKYKLKAIDEKENYFSSLAKLQYFIQDKK